MKISAIFILLTFVTSCASNTPQSKRYEDYFPPIKEENGYIVYRPSDTVPEPITYSNRKDELPLAPLPTPTPTPPEPAPTLIDAENVPVTSTEAPSLPPSAPIEDTSPAQATPPIPIERNYDVRTATPDDMAKAAPQTICGTPLHGAKKIGNPYMISGVMYYPLESADGYSEEGVASWYGPGFHGEKTANGEVYDQKAMTAAHKTLPIPTLVRVQNLENGQVAIVRINDRGPFSKGRIIDLSEVAARQIGMVDKGTAKVHISVLSENSDCYVVAGKEIDINKGNFAVQIGAFIDPANATDLASRIGSNAAVNVAEIDGRSWNRVVIKGFTTKNDAAEAVIKLSKEFPGAFIVRY